MENNNTPPPVLPVTTLPPVRHNFWKTFLLALFLGIFGVHRFAVGKTKSGLIQLLTCGGLGIWAFVDLITILLGKFTDSTGTLIPNTNVRASWAVFGVVLLMGLANGKSSSQSGSGSNNRSVAGVWVSGVSKIYLIPGGSFMHEEPQRTFFGKWENWHGSIEITHTDGSHAYYIYHPENDTLEAMGGRFKRK